MEVEQAAIHIQRQWRGFWVRRSLHLVHKWYQEVSCCIDDSNVVKTQRHKEGILSRPIHGNQDLFHCFLDQSSARNDQPTCETISGYDSTYSNDELLQHKLKKRFQEEISADSENVSSDDQEVKEYLLQNKCALSMELLWVQQAIESRRKYLQIKHQLVSGDWHLVKRVQTQAAKTVKGRPAPLLQGETEGSSSYSLTEKTLLVLSRVNLHICASCEQSLHNLNIHKSKKACPTEISSATDLSEQTPIVPEPKEMQITEKYIARKKTGLMSKRIQKKKSLNHPEWNNTVNDLTVHVASSEEQEQRRIRRKSKNVDAAKRELNAKKQGIPVDCVLSPRQVELEMRKLAVLRDVLYDHNDFNEVLRRTDKTMASVKGMSHDNTTLKSGHPVITMAPGKVATPMFEEDVEQPSRLDALSDSVMDSKALNDMMSSEESEYEDDVQFESKVDCERFLSLLKDTMNHMTRKDEFTDPVKTPENKKTAEEACTSLNSTSKVKRSLSRFPSIPNNETVNKHPESTTQIEARKIDETITSITKDTTKLKKKLNLSSVSAILPQKPPSQVNISSCNMTYDQLKHAMSSIKKGIADLEKRSGRNSLDNGTQNDGLAGFTATLIDAVTRLTRYVNEARWPQRCILCNEVQLKPYIKTFTKLWEEIKMQNLEKITNTLQEKLDHQTALTDALTLELMNTQNQVKEEKNMQQKLHQEVASMQTSEMLLTRGQSELTKKLEVLSENFTKLQNTFSQSSIESNLENDFEISQVQTNCEKEEASALKSDMLILLNALKSKNDETKSQTNNDALLVNQRLCQPLPSGLLSEETQEAAETIATVESHLRHLKLQHTEAKHRMNDLTRQAQSFAIVEDSPLLLTEYSSSSDGTSVASLPVRITAPGHLKLRSADSPPSRDIQHLPNQIGCSANTSNSASMTSFHMIEKTYPDKLSLYDSLTVQDNSPQTARQINGMMNHQHSQISLEDRISELNKQHSEAQKRLQNLVSKRRNDPAKRIQVSLPTTDILQTPHISKTAA